jgi:hypothetical protein
MVGVLAHIVCLRTDTTTDGGGCVGDEHYRIKLVAPGIDSFELLVNGGELVQELHQVLLDRENTCHRTCFSLQLDGQALDHFTEWKNIDGIKPEVTLKVVEGRLFRVVFLSQSTRVINVFTPHILHLLSTLARS